MHIILLFPYFGLCTGYLRWGTSNPQHTLIATPVCSKRGKWVKSSAVLCEKCLRGPLTSFLKGRRGFPPAHTRLHCSGPHFFLWFPDDARNHFSQKRTNSFFPWFALLHNTWSLVRLIICLILGILSALYFLIMSHWAALDIHVIPPSATTPGNGDCNLSVTN